MPKECRDCGVEKGLEEFPPAARRSDGRGSYCRACMRVRHRAGRDLARGGPPRGFDDAATRTTRTDKWCPDCQQRLPLADFGSNRSSIDGLTAYCRPCHNAAGRKNRILKHGSTRNFHLKSRYGITSEQFDAMAAEQRDLCLLCRARPPKHVDHDHLTGRVRGLLCSGCNQGLGNFKDDAARLRAAADYVERHSWQKVLEAPGVYRMVPPREAPADA